MRANCPLLRSVVLAMLPLAIALPAAAQQRVGVNSAVNLDAAGTPPGAPTRKLVIGQEVVHNERITTDAKGQTQILFLDGSSISVGPNADLIIDEFVYDPATGTGKMSITAVQGALRFVGGKLSKQDNAVTLHVGGSTIGVRGGVFVADVERGGKAQVIFVYGKAVQVSGQSGCSAELYRPGYAVDINNSQGCPDAPHAAPPGATVAIFNQLDGRAGGNGGATTVPTDTTVAASGVANTISNNVTASIQAATQNSAAPAVAPPQPTVSPPQVPTNQIQVASSQSQLPVIIAATSPPPPPPSPAPPPPQIPQTPQTPPAVNNTIAGALKTGTPGTNTGFTAPASGFAGGQLSYPDAILQNGTLSVTSTNTGIPFGSGSSSTNVTLGVSPVSAGTTVPASFELSAFTIDGVDVLHGTGTIDGITFSNGSVTVNGTTFNFAQPFATGTATATADGAFVYANLNFNNAFFGLPSSAAGAPLFIMGGTPVAPSFFTTTAASPQFYAFNLQPDFTLANGSQPQTIPFLPNFAGGTLGNASVSPLLGVNNANTQFGSFNAVNNSNVLGTPYLQASLAINGTGTNQNSALVVATGGFSTSSDNGQVIASGPVRGAIFTSATADLQQLASSSHSVVDGNGNSLFGGNAIDGFVVDQNRNTATGNFVPNTATIQQFTSGQGPVPTSYGFNQPAIATNVPSGTGANRSALNEVGFFGGTMQCCARNSTTNAIINYGLAGTVSLQTDPASSRVAATFSAGAPFIATSPSNQSPLTFSSLNALTLQFGSLPGSGPNDGRSTFIDNSVYAAAESPNVSSLITRMINGVPTTTTLPTPLDATNSDFAPQLALVTSAVVANNTLLPGGALCSSCQFSQWGYWTGRVQSPASSSGFGGGLTNDLASINTWIAGQPTVTMPTSAVGNYSGNAIGTVYNNGAQYLASGGFASSYNFGTNIGTLTISNFDGNTFSGIVNGMPGAPTYSASLTGSNLAGTANGTFFGPSAVETGGNFSVASFKTGDYFASGIYQAANTGTSNTLPAYTSFVSGLFKSTNGPGTVAGFSDQTSGHRIPYSGATITYPANSSLQNGVFSIVINGITSTLSPITPGSTTSVAGISTDGHTYSGTAAASADGGFFYADLSRPSGQRDFLFGGTPVNQNFYASQPTGQILAFQVQPDGALASGGQQQTIPFLPPNFGGTMANASVSNLYLTTGANSPFGFGSNTANIVSPKWLQASLAFNGQGAGQTSAFTVLTGSFFQNSQTNGLVVGGGSLRGTVMLSATASPVKVEDGVATVPDAAGNNLFGTSKLDGFVLDQNFYGFNGGSFTQALATASQFGQPTANYAFNQPVIAKSLPANANDPRQALNETGYFGGLLTFSGNTSLPGNPYVLSGTTAVQSTLNNNRVASTFTGSDPFTATQSGVHSMVLAFGSTNGADSAGFGTYVNNTVYAALDSPDTQSSINGNKLPLLANSTNSNPSPRIAMVTSGTVPTAINTVLPNGVTPCTCEFLQWGYWTGQAVSTTTQGLGVNRTDRAFINTWLAGTPTVTMPTSGQGSYSGAAVGTVFNNGTSYLAAGQFQQTYNFGNNTGTVNISNFDGASYSANVTGSGRTFNGPLTGVANRTGSVNGGFFGPNAVETGGNFGIQSITGTPYIASGIFAGR